MPIYEYACQDCGREFELLVRSDTRLECPGCHSSQLDKQLSVFATAESGHDTQQHDKYRIRRYRDFPSLGTADDLDADVGLILVDIDTVDMIE